MRIARVWGREVLDSRGWPTVEVEVHCANGARGSAIAPAGASTGMAEARELRDGDVKRYDGRGVLNAVRHVREVIQTALVGRDADDQFAIDAVLMELDGTPNKERLGANALLATSLAVTHAAAAAKGCELFEHLHTLFTQLPRRAGDPPNVDVVPRMPLPMTNMISGGLHAGGNLDFQDFLIQPVGAPSYIIGLEWTARVYHRLGTLLCDARYEGVLVGDEGGYGPRLPSNEEALRFIVRATEAAGLTPGDDVAIAIDAASSHFHVGDHYSLVDGGRLASAQMIDLFERYVTGYPVTSIEDGLAEEDWDGWRQMTSRLGGRCRLIGDDLFATNEARICRGIELGVANAVLIKVNQIGTLTETLRAMRLARSAGYACVVSARSGETEDTTIADLAVATAAEQIKIGSVARGERLAKYNRLLRIAERQSTYPRTA